MWRLIIVTFAFLGWSFYELSGGSDYEPAINSLQARAEIGGTRPVARPTEVRVVRLTADGKPAEELVTRAGMSFADLDLTNGNRFQITLASATADSVALATTTLQPVPTPIVEKPAAVGSAEPEPAVVEALPTDLRRITGNVVNMRSGPGTKYDRIARLTKNTKVEVLRETDDGWVKLRVVETGRVGWMANWLVTAAAN